MEELRVEVKIPEEVTIVAGPAPGREAYRTSQEYIDIDEKNILCFPNQVSRIIGSFFTGYFEELSKTMTAGEIKEHFDFDIKMPCYKSAQEAFEKYIMNNK